MPILKGVDALDRYNAESVETSTEYMRFMYLNTKKHPTAFEGFVLPVFISSLLQLF